MAAHSYYNGGREIIRAEVEDEIDPATVCSAVGSIYEGYHGKTRGSIEAAAASVATRT